MQWSAAAGAARTEAFTEVSSGGGEFRVDTERREVRVHGPCGGPHPDGNL
jgi:hypothetical protein